MYKRRDWLFTHGADGGGSDSSSSEDETSSSGSEQEDSGSESESEQEQAAESGECRHRRQRRQTGSNLCEALLHTGHSQPHITLVADISYHTCCPQARALAPSRSPKKARKRRPAAMATLPPPAPTPGLLLAATARKERLLGPSAGWRTCQRTTSAGLRRTRRRQRGCWSWVPSSGV